MSRAVCLFLTCNTHRHVPLLWQRLTKSVHALITNNWIFCESHKAMAKSINLCTAHRKALGLGQWKHAKAGDTTGSPWKDSFDRRHFGCNRLTVAGSFGEEKADTKPLKASGLRHQSSYTAPVSRRPAKLSNVHTGHDLSTFKKTTISTTLMEWNILWTCSNKSKSWAGSQI